MNSSSKSQTFTIQVSAPTPAKLPVDGNEAKDVARQFGVVVKDENAMYALMSTPEGVEAMKAMLKAKSAIKRGAEEVKKKKQQKASKTEHRKQSEKDFADEYADVKMAVSERRLKELSKDCDAALAQLGVEVLNNPVENKDQICDHLHQLYLEEQASGIVNILKRERADRFIYTVKKTFMALGKSKEEWLKFYAEEFQAATKKKWDTIKRNHPSIQLIREFPRLIATGDFGWIKQNKVKLEQQIENDKSFWKAFADQLDMKLGFSHGFYKIDVGSLHSPLTSEGYQKKVVYEADVSGMDVDIEDLKKWSPEQIAELVKKVAHLTTNSPTMAQKPAKQSGKEEA